MFWLVFYKKHWTVKAEQIIIICASTALYNEAETEYTLIFGVGANLPKTQWFAIEI